MAIIVTAQLDDESFQRFDALRRRHFPPERNVLSAHVTLFHKLDDAQAARLPEAPLPAPFPILFDGVRFLGGGVAVSISSPELTALRQALRDQAGGVFTRQDQQPFRPHVTIQNKVDAAQARKLFGEMSARFQPVTGTCVGVQLWLYLDGPWRHLRTLRL